MEEPTTAAGAGRSNPLTPRVEPGRPPIIEVEAPDAADWVAGHRQALQDHVTEHGAVLVRGLGLDSKQRAVAVMSAMLGELVAEREGFAPRTPLGDGLYSSTKWPPDQPMCMHHELSYLFEPPRMLAFGCLRAPEEGGITGLADSAAVLSDLDSDLVDRFERTGWRLIRNYNELVGISLTDAFGTEDRAAIQRYCQDNSIECTWADDGGLHTEQRRAAVVRHPVTGERCWFNQIAFLSEWTMDPDVRDYLVAAFGNASGLPFNSGFGDGGALDREIVDGINAVYDKHTLREPWRDGDLLLVDNIRMAHSTEPYQGDREIVVGMGAPVRLTEHGRFA